MVKNSVEDKIESHRKQIYLFDQLWCSGIMITTIKYYSVVSFVNYVPCPEAKEKYMCSEAELSFQCGIGRDQTIIRSILHGKYAITGFPIITMYTHLEWEILFEDFTTFLSSMWKYLIRVRSCLRYQIRDICHIS